MIKRFLQDSLIYSVPNFLSKGISLILIPVYTNILTPDDFGSFDLFMVFSSIVNLVVALEVSQGLARYYTTESNISLKKLYASSALWFTATCYLAFAILLYLFTTELSTMIFGRPNLTEAFHIGVLYIFFNGIFLIAHSILRWDLRSRDFAIVSITLTMATFLGSIYFVYFLNMGLFGILLGMLVGVIVALALTLLYLRHNIDLHLNWIYTLKMLKFSFPLVFSGLAVWAWLSIDRLMINHFLSLSDVGIYGIGCRLASTVTLLTAGFQVSLTPLIYANYQKDNTPRDLAKLLRYFVLAALYAYLILTVFSDELLKIFTSDFYHSASSLIIYLVPSVFLGGMYIFAPGVVLAKKTYLVALINIAAGAVNIVLNFFLIQAYGIVGAAFSSFVSAAIAFSCYVIIGNRFYRVPYEMLPIVSTFLFTFTIAFIVSNFQGLGQLEILLKFSTLIILFIATIGFKLLKPNELKYLVKAFKN